jgi:hypothetical protein
MKALRLRHMLAAAAIGLLAGHSAQALTITGGFSGSWYDPATNGQGFNIEVIAGASGSEVVVYWYGFDASGNPVWAVGVGSVEGNSVSAQLMRPVGISKASGFEDVADVTLSFDDCENGDADFGSGDEQVGTGSMDLVKITDVDGTDCTGGISDNFDESDEELEIRVELVDTGVFPGAGGHADFEQRTDRTDFKVEIEDLPDGIYDLVVGGEFRGSMEVVGGLEAEIEFRSPVEPGKELLDFDPRGQTIDVELDGLVVLTADMPTEPTAEDGAGDDDDDDDDGIDGFEISVALINTGLAPDAEGEAEMEIRDDRTEFEVEVEHLPPGEYDLYVGRVLRGHFPVTDETESELEFRDPVDDGHLPLDFDPRGELIEVMQNDAVYLFAEFPLEGDAIIDDDDDDADDDDADDDDDDGDDDDDDGADDDDDDGDDDDDDGDDDGDDDDDDDDDDGDDDV